MASFLRWSGGPTDPFQRIGETVILASLARSRVAQAQLRVKKSAEVAIDLTSMGVARFCCASVVETREIQ